METSIVEPCKGRTSRRLKPACDSHYEALEMPWQYSVDTCINVASSSQTQAKSPSLNGDFERVVCMEWAHARLAG
jgi:hypothetical protein